MQENIIEIVKRDLFTNQDELVKKYNETQANHVIRLRDMYNYVMANPAVTDKEFVTRIMEAYNIAKSQAYRDLAIVKMLLPIIGQCSREFHRWRFNEMIMNTYRMAEKRKDVKTMEKALSSYAKYNRIDAEDELSVPYDLIVVQPFVASSDPTLLGIKPIPNLKERIKTLINKYSAEITDIEDIDYEEADTEENELFAKRIDNEPETDIL